MDIKPLVLGISDRDGSFHISREGSDTTQIKNHQRWKSGRWWRNSYQVTSIRLKSSTELTEIVPRAQRNILRTCMHACSCCSSACRSCTTEAAAASAVVEARLPGRAQLEMETYRFLPVRMPLPVVLHCCSNCRLVSAAFYSSFSTVLKTLQQDWFFFVLYFLLFNDDGYLKPCFVFVWKMKIQDFSFSEQVYEVTLYLDEKV